MSNSFFRFKQFTVRHDLCAMKVGTDGVLLGAWTDVKNAQTILDVGTGSGLIALMLAQRSAAVIDAIDMDENACRQAEINFRGSPFASRLQIISGDYVNYSAENQYDLIVSNPPYFMDSLKSPDKQRTLARHTETLSLQDLLENSRRMLSDKGRLSLILPYDRLEIVKNLASQTGFSLTRQTNVRPVENRPPKRVLLEFSPATDKVLCHCGLDPQSPDNQSAFDRGSRVKRGMTGFLRQPHDICIEKSDHKYSEEFAALIKDFYL